jgi:hypothetical protein
VPAATHEACALQLLGDAEQAAHAVDRGWQQGLADVVTRMGLTLEDSATIRLSPATLRTGITPGTIGTTIPLSRARATNTKQRRLSKKSWVMRTSTPAWTFALRCRRSSSGEAASACVSR